MAGRRWRRLLLIVAAVRRRSHHQLIGGNRVAASVASGPEHSETTGKKNNKQIRTHVRVYGGIECSDVNWQAAKLQPGPEIGGRIDETN